MESQNFKHYLWLLLLILIATFNVFPLFLIETTGDKYIHRYYTECFLQNLQAGIYFPHWCGKINNALGAPVFISYFPMAYYLTSLFSFLPGDLVTISISAATIISALTCYVWLKRTFPAKAAFCGAILYLFLPYHMEVSLFRYSLTEAWFLAFLPLLLLTFQRFVENHWRAPSFVLMFAFCCLIHFPATMIAGLGLGIYICVDAYREKKAHMVAIYITALLISLLLCSYYLFPALYYQRFFIGNVAQHIYDGGWPNRHPSIAGSKQIWIAYVGTLVTLLMIGWFAAVYARHRRTWPLQREVIAWSLVFTAAFFLYSPLSIVFYDALPLLKSIFFPWRMQLLWLPLALYLFCSLYTYLPETEKIRFRNDVLTGSALLLLIGQTMPHYFIHNDPKLAGMRIMYNQPEHQTKWTSNTFLHYKSIEAIPDQFFESVEGDSENTLLTYDQTHHVSLTTTCKDPQCIVRLRLQYFPFWQIIEPASGLTLSPQEGSGMTLLTMPEGTFSPTLQVQIYHPNTPWWVRLSPYLSIISLIACLVALVYTRHHVPHSAAAKTSLS